MSAGCSPRHEPLQKTYIGWTLHEPRGRKVPQRGRHAGLVQEVDLPHHPWNHRPHPRHRRIRRAVPGGPRPPALRPAQSLSFAKSLSPRRSFASLTIEPFATEKVLSGSDNFDRRFGEPAFDEYL